MMLTTEKMRSGSGSGDPEKTGRPTKSGYGRKTLESGHRFMPNVSTRKLTGAIEGERHPTAKFRLLACRFRKRGYSIVLARTIRSFWRKMLLGTDHHVTLFSTSFNFSGLHAGTGDCRTLLECRVVYLYRQV